MSKNANNEQNIAYRLSQEAERGRAKGGAILSEASDIAAGCHIAGLGRQKWEPVNRKERSQFNEVVRELEEVALLNWSKNNKSFVPLMSFQNVYHCRKIGEGAEQEVFLSLEENSVLKTNDAIMHGTFLEFFNRITLHNWLFPETGYVLNGFTQVKDRFAAIIEQPFLYSARGAARNEVEQDLLLRGFRRIRNDDYYSESLGVIIEDLHDENVLLSNNSLLLYFDPILYLETPEMKLAGREIYRFPF